MQNISPLSLSGILRLSANLNSSVNVTDENSISRPPSSAQVAIDYSDINFLGPVKFSSELFGNLNSFVNSANVGTTNEEFSFRYGAGSSVSFPKFKSDKDKVSFFNPKFSLVFNSQENEIIGNYFIGADELSWGNIYTGRKIMSLTESEEGVSISLGLEGKVFWDSGQRMELSLAASKIGGLTYNPDPNPGLTAGKVNYLGKFLYENIQNHVVAANALFSADGKLLNGDLKAKYLYNKFGLEGTYQSTHKDLDSRLSENLKSFELTSSYSFSDDFFIKSASRYDLTSDQMAATSLGLGFNLGAWQYKLNQEYLQEERDKFSLSAIYDDDCTRITFSFENRYQDIGSSGPVKALTLRLQLKPFANVIFSQGDDQITF